MEWIRSHTSLIYGIMVALVIIAGAVVVSDKFATTSRGSLDSWGAYGDAGGFVPGDSFAGSPREGIAIG